MDSRRLTKLLEVAGHPATNPHEAANAIQAVRAMLEREGLTFAELPSALGLSTSTLMTLLKKRPEKKSNSEVESLKRKVEELEAELIAKKQPVTIFKPVSKKVVKKVFDESVSWEIFEKVARKIIPRDDWEKQVATHLHLSPNALQKLRRGGRVPSDTLDSLLAHQPVVVERKSLPKRIRK